MIFLKKENLTIIDMMGVGLMTFKDMKDEQEKESIFKLVTPADKAGIIVGVVINIALIILYIVMRFF